MCIYAFVMRFATRSFSQLVPPYHQDCVRAILSLALTIPTLSGILDNNSSIIYNNYLTLLNICR